MDALRWSYLADAMAAGARKRRPTLRGACTSSRARAANQHSTHARSRFAPPGRTALVFRHDLRYKRSAEIDPHSCTRGHHLARPNFEFQKRQKELEKKRRKEEKKQKKLDRAATQPAPPDAGATTETT
jgi:hypothetical protein